MYKDEKMYKLPNRDFYLGFNSAFKGMYMY